MLVVLPPSEGKAAPARGKPLDLSTLVYPELAAARDRAIDELVELSRLPDAAKRLKVSAGLAAEVAANTLIRQVPTAAAERVYTGVLYDALDPASLDSAARRRMGRRVLIFSALFGVLRVADRIPAYRLSGGVSLGSLGSISSYWRRVLEPVVSARGMVVDCRSSAYASMWAPPGTHLPVRVFREVDGERSVVSHMAKHSRGLVARALCESASEPKDAGELADLLNGYFAGHEVTTASGAVVELRVEPGESTIDVITN